MSVAVVVLMSKPPGFTVRGYRPLRRHDLRMRRKMCSTYTYFIDEHKA